MKAHQSLILVALALVGPVLSTLPHPLSEDAFHQLVQQHGADIGLRMLEDRMLELEDADLTAPQMIAKYGYPVETHEVTTADGYILTMHRIPYGKLSGPAPNKPVVWLQHGVLCDSSNWIMNKEDKALAYVLANRGYDVWLGNARGNTYSRGHVSLSTKDSEYWQFSWHEMGVYDVPAVMDHILKTTGQPDLYYVGHSMGTTMFFVAMAMDPSLNSKIRIMSALAPVAYIEYADTPLMLMAPFVDQIEWLLEFIGVDEFLPTSAFMDFIGAAFCHDNSPVQAVCSNVLFLIAGYNSDQLNTTALPVILAHTPAGSSTRALVHYAQMVTSGVFRQYDHGRKQNIDVYGTEEPPAYDISKITVPVAIYWGDNDWLAGTADVYHLSEELPNLVRKYRIRHDKYNHLDFLWAIDNHIQLNNHIIEYMERY